MMMQDAVSAFIEKEIASRFVLKTVDRDGKETTRKPKVIRSGWVLPRSVGKKKQTDEIFPYICPRIEKQENVKNERTSIVTLLILFGAYDPGAYGKDGEFLDDGSGYRDVWNMIETTRQAFFIQHTIDERYRVMDDFFEAAMLEEQEYPYWEGYCRFKLYEHYPLPKKDAFLLGG
jgi:hypothetical protein